MAIEIKKDVEQIVYFSTKSGNTHRFVEKLGLPAVRVPIHADSEMPEINTPYILITPTYGGGHAKGAVPKQVIRFLNDSARRHLMRGVIGTGNTNFGEAFAVAGDIVSQKCQVPLLYRLELFGTDDDVHNVKTGVQSLWKQSR